MYRIAGSGLLLLVACEADPASVAWRIEFDEPVAASDAVRVEAYVASGGCQGPRIFQSDLRRDQAGPQPGALAPGAYGFGAEAVDEACHRIATGCVAVDWPRDSSPVVVRLEAITPQALCSALQCVDAECEAQDDLPCGTSGPCSGPVVEVSAGRSHTCARTAAGEVWCWGRNAEGQLGRMTTPEVPGRVSLPRAARQISAGGPVAQPSGHTCAVLDDDSVWCWGANDIGQSEPGADAAIVSPVAVDSASPAIAVRAGGRHTCAHTRTGGVECWGAGEQFQLGDGLPTERGGPLAVPISQVIVALGLGDAHACAVSDNERLLCWGRAEDGQLGNVTANATPNIIAVNNGLDVRIASVGANHVCFVRNGPPATAACFGSNEGLQIGLDEERNAKRPTEPPFVATPEDIVDIAAGTTHTCLLRSDGRVYCFGDNADGQLGAPNIVRTSTPTAVEGLDSVVDITAGFGHTCAVRGNGEVHCWGRNRFGQLGDGSTEARFAPVRTIGLGVQ